MKRTALVFAIGLGSGILLANQYLEHTISRRLNEHYRQKALAFINNKCLEREQSELALKFETTSGTHTLICANGSKGEGCVLDSETKPKMK